MKYTLIFPIAIVLMTIADLGKKQPAYEIDGKSIVTAIIVCFGLWFLGYIEGKYN